MTIQFEAILKEELSGLIFVGDILVSESNLVEAGTIAIVLDDETIHDVPSAQLRRRSRPTTAVNMRRLAFETTEPIQFVDMTDEIAECVRAAGISDGIVTIVSRHTTAAVRIQEAEPLLLEYDR